MGEVILTMKDIDKSFPGVHALDHVNFEVKRGEVHALMGENGAGKSTLMKVLTGIYQKDSGSIVYKGQETEFHNTREAQDAGVVIVHQELNMVGDLTVAQNIFIGREPKKGFRIDDKKMIEDSKKLFQDLNIEINPKEKMKNLTVGKQQMCEIAKAISHKAEVIIFDEPSAALTEKEIADLFEIIRDLRKKNLGIVYISHRMDEIKTITDRVTVMRDGGYVGTLITKDSTKEDIINMMVGRVIYEDPKQQSAVPADAPVVLKVEHLNAGKMVQDVSFELKQGECLGIVGESGSGKSTIARMLTHLEPVTDGQIFLKGKDITHARGKTLRDIYQDIQMVFQMPMESFDPRRTLGDGIGESLRNMGISHRETRERVENLLEKCGLEKEFADRYPHQVSGGQCQRAAIARALAVDPEILICDEATSALDVTVQKQILELLIELKEKENLSFLLICHDLALVQALCDKVLVLYHGKTVEYGSPDEIIDHPKMDYTKRLIESVL